MNPKTAFTISLLITAFWASETAAVPQNVASPAPNASFEATGKEAEQAGRFKDALELYVRAIQGLPDPPPFDDDIRLRERAIVVAARLATRPPLPEDAERFGVQGQVLFRDAKDASGFEKSEALLRKAVRAAPWAPTLAFNLALVQEKLGFYRSAAANLKLYLLSAPAETTEVKAKMYEFELKRDSDPEAAAKEKCALGDRQGCRELAQRSRDHFHKAIDSGGPDNSLRQESFAKAYVAAEFACARARVACGELGRLLLYAWISDMPGSKWLVPDPFGADVLKRMGVVADGDRAANLLIEACRAETEYTPGVSPCLMLDLSYSGVMMLESRMTRKTENIDRLFKYPAMSVRCPGTPQDCLAKGVILQNGMGQKKVDKSGAKKAYEFACKAGVKEACERRQKL